MGSRRRPSPGVLAQIGLRAAGVAHDFAQPLTAALLAAREVEGKGAHRLREALHRLEDLLAQMRSELQPPAKRPPRQSSVDLAQMRRQLLADLSAAERRRARIRLAGKARGDPLVLQRIVGNLLLNALRHGSGLVHVNGSARGRKLSITVEGGAARQLATPGWGIGLSSCQDLARRHSLSLQVDISPAGSRATLTNQA